MNQALHIFKKDVRYLRWEIGLVLTLAAAYAWAETHSRLWWISLLLIISSGYLIARLIHAEAIPGDNQFWITRPYRWKSLLGSKLLFILVFVNLPILAARMVTLHTFGFSLASTFPSLLWSQLLIFLAASLPVAALAAVTARLVPFIFSILILSAIGAGIQEMMVPPSLPSFRLLLGPVQWVWDAAGIAALIAIALPVLYIQYKTRQTVLSRTFALGVAVIGALAYLYMPWPAALAIQTRLSKRPFDPASIHIQLDPPLKNRLSGFRSRVDLPLAVSGIPDDIEVQADALALTFLGADGQTWKSGFYDGAVAPRLSKRPDATVFDGFVYLDPAFLGTERKRVVTVRGSIYLTLFGGREIKSIPIQAGSVNAVAGLQCYAGPFNAFFSDLMCQSALRWPERLVFAKYGETDVNSFAPWTSYSPFPASLGLDSVETREVAAPRSARQVAIMTEEPLEHIHRDFEIQGVELADFAAPRK